MDNPKDEIAAATARTDQAREEIKNVAPVLGEYFRALLQQGLERCEALELVRDVQASMLDGEGDD